MLGLFSRLKNLFKPIPQIEFTTKYLWEFEYGDPESEFNSVIQEHLIIATQQNLSND